MKGLLFTRDCMHPICSKTRPALGCSAAAGHKTTRCRKPRAPTERVTWDACMDCYSFGVVLNIMIFHFQQCFAGESNLSADIKGQ